MSWTLVGHSSYAHARAITDLKNMADYHEERTLNASEVTGSFTDQEKNQNQPIPIRITHRRLPRTKKKSIGKYKNDSRNQKFYNVNHANRYNRGSPVFMFEVENQVYENQFHQLPFYQGPCIQYPRTRPTRRTKDWLTYLDFVYLATKSR